MEQEIVAKKKWIDHSHFMDLIGITNLIPGPNSTELTMHCGYEKAGIRGLFVAGLCFILPAVLITAFCAYLYQRYQQLPAWQGVLTGITPVILAIVLQAAYNLTRNAVKSKLLSILLLFTIVACFLGMNEIALLFGTGIGYMLLTLLPSRINTYSFLPLLQNIFNGSFVIDFPVKIFFIFLKIGALLYGSGYVLFAFLKSELLDKGLITEQQLMDAIAVGHFTPGPLFSTATFIGWQMDGWRGALLATAGIFMPSFFFVWLVRPLIPRLRQSRWMSAFLDGVNVAAIGLILFVAFSLGQNSLTDWRTVSIFIAAVCLLLFLPKINSAFLIAAGGIGGYLFLS
jgi:chromate transporter